MYYRQFVYIPSEEVKEMIYAILAKKGWRTSFHPSAPFYLYAPDERDDDRLGWDRTPYTDGGRYTEIGINELLEEDHGTN